MLPIPSCHQLVTTATFHLMQFCRLALQTHRPSSSIFQEILMRITNRKYAITGASRGLGAALAMVMAEEGADLVLLARTKEALQGTQGAIRRHTGQEPATIACDLADQESSTLAGSLLTEHHPDLDGVIHNGAMWLPGSMDEVTDVEIQNCVASAATGTLILTRHLLPNLKSRDNADIHTVVSTSGLQTRRLGGGSIAFQAAKSAQAGFVNGLSDELAGTGVRVSAVYPGNFDDISPEDRDWNDQMSPERQLSNREVVEAILFILNQPPRVTVSSIVIE